MNTTPERGTNPRQERNLVAVVQVASALSLGTLAALLYSVKSVVPSIRFQFSPATLVAFLLAAAGSVAFWHLAFQLGSLSGLPSAGADAPGRKSRKMWLAILTGLLGAALLLAFIYPIKDFSREKASEISYGAIIAVGFLSVLGLLMWRVIRYLESEPK